MLASIGWAGIGRSFLLILGLSLLFSVYGVILLGWLRRRAFVLRLACWLLAGATVYSVLGTLLALCGLFRPWALVAAVGFTAVVALRHRRDRAVPPESIPQPAVSAPVWAQVILVVSLLLMALLYAPNAETLLIGGDPAVYTLAGIELAESGSLYFQPDWAPELGYAGVRQLFHQSGTLQMTRHWMPFYQPHVNSASVEIGFMPLTKVWVALGAMLVGPEGATAVSGFASLVALLALGMLLGRRGRWGLGILALWLLGLSLPQVWFARQATSEIYAQMGLLGTLCLLALTDDRDRQAPVLRIIAAASLALLPLTRFEGLVIALPTLALLWLGYRTSAESDGPPDRWYLWTAAASLLAALLAAIAVPHYVATSLALLLTPSRARWLTLGIGLATVAGLYLWRGRNTLARRCAFWLTPRVLQSALALGWILWGTFAAVCLLRLPVAETLPGWLSQYLTWPALALALLGSAWVAHRGLDEADPETWTLNGLGLLFLIVFSLNHYVTPVHPWAVRRLLPAVWPALAVGMASLVVWPGSSIRDRLGRLASLLGGLVRWAAALALLAAILTTSWPILLHKEYDGFWQQLRTLAADLDPGAVLILDSSPISAGLSQPLEMLFGHPSFCVPVAVGDDVGPQLDHLVAQARDAGRRPYLLTTGGDLDWYPADGILRHLSQQAVCVPALAQSVAGPPSSEDVSQLAFSIVIYEIADTQSSAPLTITAAPADAPYLREGFYAAEGTPEQGFIRWTDGDARLILPQHLLPDGPLRVTLLLTGGRPDPTEVGIWLQGALLDQVVLPAGFEPQTVEWNLNGPLPACDGRTELALTSDAWSPTDGDARQLGIVFRKLTIEPVSAQP